MADSNQDYAAENKNFEEMEIDYDGNPQEFDVQRKIHIASAPYEKFQCFIVVGLLVIILALNLVLVAIGSANLNQVSDPPPACDSNAITGALMSSNSDQFSGLSQTLQDLSDQISNQSAYTVNNSEALNDIMESTSQQLKSIIGSLTTIEGTTTETAGSVNDILIGVNQILNITNASQLLNTLQTLSCLDVYNAQPNSPSGYYHINSENVYCNMDNLCGQGGGWTRLAYLNMADGTSNCPTGFKYYQTGGVRACGRQSNQIGCTGTSFTPTHLSYSKVCGKVIGYQYGSTEGLLGSNGNINSHYLDGISITYGSPRNHIWTLISGLRQNNIDGGFYNCPCSQGSVQTVPGFIGDNYYCESGNPHFGIFNQLFTDDPLWDGEGCSTLETNCCTNKTLPWFYRDFGNVSITDPIELRICGNQNDLEDSPVGLYEIYVK
uniref:Fibrinogen C-terminal domain-containing protein n=1 Tax=Amphimedon queenslandica TaxID=400682 RepID=A0A1X7VPU0_AMPQE